MKLIRELGRFPAKHLGPEPDGTFWALKGANDLPKSGPVMEADLEYLIQVGKVWVQDAQRPGTWERVVSLDSLPEFKTVWYDDYDACTSAMSVVPHMPEFYFIPTSWRGRRFLRRAMNRAK